MDRQDQAHLFLVDGTQLLVRKRGISYELLGGIVEEGKPEDFLLSLVGEQLGFAPSLARLTEYTYHDKEQEVYGQQSYYVADLPTLRLKENFALLSFDDALPILQQQRSHHLPALLSLRGRSQ